jgi:PilZ domain
MQFPLWQCHVLSFGLLHLPCRELVTSTKLQEIWTSEERIPTEGLRPLSGVERREWDRLPIAIPFFMRGKKPTGEEFLEFTTALNISAGGVLLATKRYLEPNTRISLEVPIALVNKTQLPHSVSLLHATVVRVTAERRYYLLGVQFEKPLIAASSESEGDSSAANSSEDHSPE